LEIGDPKNKNVKKGIVVSGDSLITIMKDDKMSTKLNDIAQQCEAVLCCRVSPKMKQQIVRLVRDHLPKARTLSIGDGANDVNMITEAHVGIGIKGLEGQQAARSSDYAIGEFKHLRRLIFVYGRESYRKNTKLILYSFYKNIV
jgi:phospholipid-transporting ATPase